VTIGTKETGKMYPRVEGRSGFYGYWADGGWAVRPRFLYAYPFHGGYAAVRLVDGQIALLARDGALFPVAGLCEGRTLHGEPYISGFDGMDRQPSDYATVRVVEGGRPAWGLIDRNLKYRRLPPEVFSQVGNIWICKDHLIVQKDGRNGCESPVGLFSLASDELELPFVHRTIRPSVDSYWVVADRDGYAFYDAAAKRVLPGRYTSASPFSCGFAGVHVGPWDATGREFFVDEQLRPAFDAEFGEVGDFAFGLAAFHNYDVSGYLDTSGAIRIETHYQMLQPFNRHGLALANRDDCDWDIDIIDRTGTPRLSGFDTADYTDGDHPCFEVTAGGRSFLYDVDLSLVY